MFHRCLDEKPEFLISARNPVYFIAEIGGNHEGNYELAVRQLNLALQAGVDAVKFQVLSGDRLVSPLESPDRNLHFKRFELKRHQFEALAAMCRDSNTGFLASIWERESIAWVDPLVPMHKIGSGDMNAFPLIREIVKTAKPVLLSTGLSTMDEVKRTVEFIDQCDTDYVNHKKIVLMQCTSSYPTPDEDANLRVIQALREEFGLPVGYSDHTLGSEAAYLAVVLGAQVLELHFTDQREGRTFRDHQISVTWDEVEELMERIRRAQALLGSSRKEVTPSEKGSGHVKSFRRSIYAARDLEVGTRLCADDLTVLRPEHGIPAHKYGCVLGKEIRRARKKYEPVQEEDIY